MKSFKTFQKQPTLNIFDVDGTLFNSDTPVNIKRDGKIVKTLSHSEYNRYKLQDGESYDWTYFKSGKFFHDNAVPIDRMIDRARRAVSSETDKCKTIIITARGDLNNKNLYLKKFADHGFPIDQVYIERSGNLGLSAPEGKIVVIRGYLNTKQWSRIRMWDDAEINLQHFLRLRREYPNVTFEAYLVIPETGETRKYHGT